MGFALWVEGEVAWAEGRHEYQPMGAAVIARTDLFRERDFRRSRRRLDTSSPGYAGLFASLGDVNAFLAGLRARTKPVTSALEESRRGHPVAALAVSVRQAAGRAARRSRTASPPV